MRRWLASVAAVAVTALLIVGWIFRHPARVERTAVMMDTPVRVVVYGPEARAEEAADAALQEVQRLEDLWHPNRSGSDVARINRAAGRDPVKVSPETLALVQLSLDVAASSDGAFDPTVGPLVKAWGFGSQGRVPSTVERERAMSLVDWQAVQVDKVAGTVYLSKPGMALDLGAAAKGYAAGLVREQLSRRGISSALVQLGGSVALLGQRPEGGAWQIAVQHPRESGQYLTVLSLEEGFVDTAGDYQRFFVEDGVRYHHILNPSTGEPARGLASVTVISQRAEWSDAYATAAFVLGMEPGLQFLSRQPGVEAILVSTEGRVQVTPGLQGKVQVEAKPWS